MGREPVTRRAADATCWDLFSWDKSPVNALVNIDSLSGVMRMTMDADSVTRGFELAVAGWIANTAIPPKENYE